MKSIVVAGTHSGVGKTCVAVGLMAAFCRRGLRVQPFKVGPDFLDPMHHRAATGRDSYNLDGWMLSREVNLQCFMRNLQDTDIAIVEGVMGLYDGRDGKLETGSTAEMAKILGAPVILVLDASALSRSAAAMVFGYTSFDPDLRFAGVILNKVGSPAHLSWLCEALESPLLNVPVLGGLPKSPGVEVPERHLGLQMPGEDGVPQELIDRLADLIEQHVNLDAILENAGDVHPPIPEQVGLEGEGDGEIEGEEAADVGLGVPALAPLPPGKPVRIGVAMDAAFCFYYHENLALLQDAGAELVFFSPIHDALPPRLDAIYLGGGYPELHAQQLAQNTRMLYAMRAFAAAGGIIYGECGGLMYLSQSVETREGERHAMCGVFPFRTRMVPQMKMGYITVKGTENNSLFPPELGEIRGQIFHFSEVIADDPSENGSRFPEAGFYMQMQIPGASPEAGGYLQGAVLASYVHLHLGSNPEAAQAFVELCRETTSKAAAVAAASASAVADSGPVAAAAAGAAAAAAVVEALGEPHSNLNSDEESASDLVRTMSTSSMLMHTPRQSFRRRSESAWWDTKGQLAGGETMAANGSCESSLRESGSQHLRRDVQDAPPGQKGAMGFPAVRPMRRSMSEYWGSLQTRRRGRRNSITARCDSLDARTLSPASATWGSPDSKTSSDEEVHGAGPERRGITLPNGHSDHPAVLTSPGSERGYSTPRRNSGSPGASLGATVTQNGVSFRIGDSGGSREDLRVRSGEKLGRALSDDVDTPSSSDGGDSWENHQWGKAQSFSPEDWSSSKGRGSTDTRGGGLGSEETGNKAGASPPSALRTNESFVDRGLLPIANGRMQPMASLDRPPVPTKILSLQPSATEILMELGSGDRLIGITDLCDYPEDVRRGRRVVCRSKLDAASMSSREVEIMMRRFQEKKESLFELDVPWLRAVQPDLIFTQDTCARCDVDASDVAKALDSAELLDNPDTETIVLQPHTLADVLEAIITVGESVGLAPRAYALVEQLRMRLRHVARTVAGEPRPRVLSLEGLSPLVMGGYWLPEMKSIAGAVDGLQEPGCQATKVVWEKVTAYAPEVLILTPCSSNIDRTLSEVKCVANLPGFWSLPAVQHCRVFICEHSLFSRPGPRLVDGVEVLARLMHPSRVRSRLPPGVVLKLQLAPGQRCRPDDVHKHFQPYQ